MVEPEPKKDLSVNERHVSPQAVDGRSFLQVDAVPGQDRGELKRRGSNDGKDVLSSLRILSFLCLSLSNSSSCISRTSCRKRGVLLLHVLVEVNDEMMIFGEEGMPLGLKFGDVIV